MKISQREARRLRKRVQELETILIAQRRTWAQEYPGGVQISSAKWEQTDPAPMAVKTARALKHAVVVLLDDDGRIRFMALPHADVA